LPQALVAVPLFMGDHVREGGVEEEHLLSGARKDYAPAKIRSAWSRITLLAKELVDHTANKGANG
jgi:hypothetical protein